jgi:hypothetical protein
VEPTAKEAAATARAESAKTHPRTAAVEEALVVAQAAAAEAAAAAIVAAAGTVGTAGTAAKAREEEQEDWTVETETA